MFKNEHLEGVCKHGLYPSTGPPCNTGKGHMNG